MTHQAKDYMETKVNTIDISAIIKEGAEAMAADEQSQGYVIVLKKGKPVGIMTERDIVNQVDAHSHNPSKMVVADIMSTPLVTIDHKTDLTDAAELMKTQNIHKLVVVQNDIIYGILTEKSIIQRFREYVNRSVKDVLRWNAPFL